MTKNHIFIKSVALGALLLLSPLAHASVDQVLVTYFNKVLYKDQSPKCSVDDATKTRFLAELEPKCLIRSISNGEPFISGVKSECGEIFVKATVDTKVQSLCANTAAVQQEKFIAQQQAAAAKQQAAVASGQSGGDAKKPSLSSMVKEGRDLYKKIDKVYDNREKYEEKASKVWNKITGKEDDKNDGKIAEIPKIGSTNIHGNNVAPATNAAIDAANVKIAEYNKKIEDSQQQLDMMKDNRNQVCGNSLYDQSKCASYDKGIANKEQELTTLKEQQLEAQKEQVALTTKEAEAKLKDAPDSMRDTANQQVLGEGAQAAAAKPDAVTGKADQAAETAAKASDAKAETAAAQPKADAAVAPVNCAVELQALESAYKSYSLKKTICVKAANTAENFCDKARSPGLMQVQQYMVIGSAVLSKVTAASEACGTTSTLSKVAQAGVLAAQLTCSTVKLTCDKGCAAAEKALTALETANNTFKTCSEKVKASAVLKNTTATTKNNPQLNVEANNEMQHSNSVVKAALDYDAIIADEKKPATVTDKMGEDGKPSGKEVAGGSERMNATARCGIKAKADVMMMGATALGLLSAHLDAQKCKEQLEAGSGNGGKNSTSAMAGAQLTTAEYCSQPSNASSVMCKCTANPTADGCIGSAAGSGLALGKVNTNGTLSGFAGPGKGNGNTLADAAKKAGENSDEPAPGAGLSEAAREALGLDSASSVAAAAGGGGGSGESAPEAKAGADKDDKAKPRFSLMSSIGSMFSGGSKPSQAAKAAIRGYEQEQAIKRKVASEQIRSQITTASGKSNFDKIKSRYQSNVSSFEQ